ncbi:ComEA family DNA-binding protein [Pedobacter aquatilis]|uniref:ComEA family DNA-binding protein n=1 Tax=Pedobacter aquatilis TaxID=351343 RepID=UPI00292E654E|nr:helix-hairpin-helix domain-containing protein [Pedobacter aquatilis]
MGTWLNRNFGFNKGEFNGIILLIVLIGLLKSFPLIYNFYKPLAKDAPDLRLSIQKITIRDEESYATLRDKIEHSEVKPASRLFRFDPNTIDAGGWQALGLSPKQAQSIINYRNKGGKFYKAEDLQRMYTISADMYNKLLPYVSIVKQFPERKDFQYERKAYVKQAPVIVEINGADSAQLDAIKGIGPAFAIRILKYRERLGGFYRKEQLMEVYGLDSAKYNEIKEQVSINPTAIRTININTADFNALKLSPYLSFKQINAIIQYRKQHGNYRNEDDLKKVAILPPQLIDKLLPYLSF